MPKKELLTEVFAQFESAIANLKQIEGAWETALANENIAQSAPELAILEDKLHVYSHELASELWFVKDDLTKLLARAKTRTKHDQFSVEDFNLIVSKPWSIELIQQIHEKYPAQAKAALSKTIKQIQHDWHSIPT